MAKVKEVKVDEKNDKYIELTDGTKVYQRDADVEDLLYSAYIDKFTSGKTDNKTWIATFVDRQLDSLKQNLKSDPSTALSSMRELNRTVNKTQSYFNSKKAVDVDFSKYLLRDKLFEWQRKVYDDPNHKKTMLCGRRSGKTHCAVRLALKEALEKDEKPREIVIIGLTLERTAGLYWQPLKDAVEEAHISTNRIDNGSYTIYFSNGNSIQLFGNNSKAEREKLRGKDSYMYIIDEMQSQTGLYYLMIDILEPIIRGRNGKFVLLGTGPISAGTYWESIVENPEWSHFSATMQDNPTIPDYEHALEKVLAENHWTKDNITFRREYLGLITFDTSRMIVGKRTYYEEIPQTFKPNGAVIAFDPGWQDFSSFATVLYSNNGDCYLYDEFRGQHVPSSNLVERAKIMVEKVHKNFNIPLEDIVIVQDTSHQMILADLYNQGFTNVVNAYKLDEKTQWDRLSEACECGYFYVKKDGAFDQECNNVIWKFDDEKQCVIYEIDEKTAHPHIMDSVKYAYCYIYSNVLYNNYNGESMRWK